MKRKLSKQDFLLWEKTMRQAGMHSLEKCPTRRRNKARKTEPGMCDNCNPILGVKHEDLTDDQIDEILGND